MNNIKQCPNCYDFAEMINGSCYCTQCKIVFC